MTANSNNNDLLNLILSATHQPQTPGYSAPAATPLTSLLTQLSDQRDSIVQPANDSTCDQEAPAADAPVQMFSYVNPFHILSRKKPSQDQASESLVEDFNDRAPGIVSSDDHFIFAAESASHQPSSSSAPNTSAKDETDAQPSSLDTKGSFAKSSPCGFALKHSLATELDLSAVDINSLASGANVVQTNIALVSSHYTFLHQFPLAADSEHFIAYTVKQDKIRVIEKEFGKKFLLEFGHEITAINWGAGNRLLAVGESGYFAIWKFLINGNDVSSTDDITYHQTIYYEPKVAEERIIMAKFDHQPREVLAIVDQENCVQIIDVNLAEQMAGGALAKFAGKAVTSLAFTPDGKSLLTCGPDGVALWNVPASQQEAPVTEHCVLSEVVDGVPCTVETLATSNSVPAVVVGYDGNRRVELWRKDDAKAWVCTQKILLPSPAESDFKSPKSAQQGMSGERADKEATNLSYLLAAGSPPAVYAVSASGKLITLKLGDSEKDFDLFTHFSVSLLQEEIVTVQAGWNSSEPGQVLCCCSKKDVSLFRVQDVDSKQADWDHQFDSIIAMEAQPELKAELKSESFEAEKADKIDKGREKVKATPPRRVKNQEQEKKRVEKNEKPMPKKGKQTQFEEAKSEDPELRKNIADIVGKELKQMYAKLQKEQHEQRAQERASQQQEIAALHAVMEERFEHLVRRILQQELQRWITPIVDQAISNSLSRSFQELESARMSTMLEIARAESSSLARAMENRICDLVNHSTQKTFQETVIPTWEKSFAMFASELRSDNMPRAEPPFPPQLQNPYSSPKFPANGRAPSPYRMSRMSFQRERQASPVATSSRMHEQTENLEQTFITILANRDDRQLMNFVSTLHAGQVFPADGNTHLSQAVTLALLHQLGYDIEKRTVPYQDLSVHWIMAAWNCVDPHDAATSEYTKQILSELQEKILQLYYAGFARQEKGRSQNESAMWLQLLRRMGDTLKKL